MHVRIVNREVASPRVQFSEEPHPIGTDETLARRQFADRLTASVEQRLVTGSQEFLQPPQRYPAFKQMSCHAVRQSVR